MYTLAAVVLDLILLTAGWLLYQGWTDRRDPTAPRKPARTLLLLQRIPPRTRMLATIGVAVEVPQLAPHPAGGEDPVAARRALLVDGLEDLRPRGVAAADLVVLGGVVGEALRVLAQLRRTRDQLAQLHGATGFSSPRQSPTISTICANSASANTGYTWSATAGSSCKQPHPRALPCGSPKNATS